jgi:hypothetical protein
MLKKPKDGKLPLTLFYTLLALSGYNQNGLALLFLLVRKIFVSRKFFPFKAIFSLKTFSLVDGEAFFDKIADSIEMASDDIFISGWWICSELYMKRPMIEGHKWRLDQLLLRAAKRGVHVFILQYNELKWAFGHNSIYGKRTLKKLHKNIKVGNYRVVQKMAILLFFKFFNFHQGVFHARNQLSSL